MLVSFTLSHIHTKLYLRSEISKKFGEKVRRKNIVEKLGKNRIRIIELIVSNPNITYSELAEALSVSSTTIKNRIAAMSGVIIKRVGPKNGGHWEIIEN